MNSSMYHQIAKTNVADRLQAAEHARTLRAARPARQRRLPGAAAPPARQPAGPDRHPPRPRAGPPPDGIAGRS
jgi:hypothetical protein